MRQFDRRQVIYRLSCAIALPGLIVGREARAQTPVLGKDLTITSVSWIDAEGLPDVSFWDATGGWPFNVMVGLVATKNPRPKDELPEDFISKKHYRAMASYKISQNGTVSDLV